MDSLWAQQMEWPHKAHQAPAVAEAMAGRQHKRGRKSKHSTLFAEGSEETGDWSHALELSAFVSSVTFRAN
jgi:hypothetical protein